MSDTLTDLNIKYGITFMVNESVMRESNAGDNLIEREKNAQLEKFGKIIDLSKKDMWTDHIDYDTNTHVFSAKLYILTPDELRRYRQSIIDKVKRGEINE